MFIGLRKDTLKLGLGKGGGKGGSTGSLAVQFVLKLIGNHVSVGSSNLDNGDPIRSKSEDLF